MGLGVAKSGWTAVMLMLLGCAAGGLTPFERDGLWGYRDAAGRIAIEPRYLVADAFSAHGLAAVADETGWAYIDASGRDVIRPFLLDNGPDPFSEGLARFLEDGRFGFFDERGRVAIEPRFDFVMPFHEGLAAACQGCSLEPRGEHSEAVGGLWGFVDRTGRWAIPPAYEAAGEFDGGEARVMRDGIWFSIDRKGRALK